MNAVLEHLPLAIVVLGVLILAKWDRDKRIANREFHTAYRDGLEEGYKDARETWRKELETGAKAGLAELIREYPVAVKVVENRPASKDASLTGIGRETVELPRLAYTIIVEPRTRQPARYGELKATWEKRV